MTQWKTEPKAKAGTHLNSWIPIYKCCDSTECVADTQSQYAYGAFEFCNLSQEHKEIK